MLWPTIGPKTKPQGLWHHPSHGPWLQPLVRTIGYSRWCTMTTLIKEAMVVYIENNEAPFVHPWARAMEKVVLVMQQTY